MALKKTIIDDRKQITITDSYSRVIIERYEPKKLIQFGIYSYGTSEVKEHFSKKSYVFTNKRSPYIEATLDKDGNEVETIITPEDGPFELFFETSKLNEISTNIIKQCYLYVKSLDDWSSAEDILED